MPSSRVLKKSLGSPAVASTTGVHAAVTDTGSPSVVTTGITNPAVPRNITVTAGGTSGDIKAIKVTVEGTNVNGDTISEEIGPFTVDTTGTKEGAKAFKTVTKITIPAHDGTGATTAVGFGEKLGLGAKLGLNTVLHAHLNSVREGTAPTVAVSSSAIESNTVDLSSACNGSPVIVFYTKYA